MSPAFPPPSVRDGRALVLDGGLSNGLADQGLDVSGDGLWTARPLADGPGGRDALVAAHAAYLRAGAEVVTTASYQASFEGFARAGFGRGAAERLFGDSVRLARRAVADSGWRAYVAASVGPYGAVLADGSEYRGRYGLGVAELTRFHRPRVEALVAAGPDVLALETVPDVREAEALLRAVEACGVPVWLSYTVADGRTRAGQPLAEAFALAAGVEQVVAVGVNCCDPREALPAVEVAVAVTGGPAVVYPNSGETWDVAGRRWRGRARADAGAAVAWRAAGARLIGGCCRVGPADIAALAGSLTA
ncbi:homocysteine S-methyltransferase [Streptomyces avicenniae]|uniref:homocysteine S-methyltransferase n=1 Tax=Streptomyces avicenniae TaxID=500153 RepID=UPI00069C83E5|nr:homocysteine S-methyltransferase [Streptomyces avicenniae]